MKALDKNVCNKLPFFIGNNANQLWKEAANFITYNESLNFQDGRGGRIIELLHANFLLTDPLQRWISVRQPAINPAFAIAECIWFIMGRNDSSFINSWNSQLKYYAGSGDVYYGAYGYRLIKHFGINQLFTAYDALKNNSNSRQIVLQIWDATFDLPINHGKPRDADIPCNLLSLLKVREKKLEWTQIVRSNDLFLGVPYNMALFTFLQELMASWLEIEVGHYYQLSDSLHVYEKEFNNVKSSIKTQQELTDNTDRIKITKDETIKYFTELCKRSEAVVNIDAKLSKISELMNWEDAPEFLQNYLYVLGAEAARKRKKYKIANDILRNCSNPMLCHLWDNWVARVSK